MGSNPWLVRYRASGKACPTYMREITHMSKIRAALSKSVMMSSWPQREDHGPGMHKVGIGWAYRRPVEGRVGFSWVVAAEESRVALWHTTQTGVKSVSRSSVSCQPPPCVPK